MGEALLGGLLGAAAGPRPRTSPSSSSTPPGAASWPSGSRARRWPTRRSPPTVRSLAVKPQHVAEVCAASSASSASRGSCRSPPASGLAIDGGRGPRGTAVVRAMPNTPALVGVGAAAIAGGRRRRRGRPGLGRGDPRRGRHRGARHRGPARRRHRPVGSGPAYVFLVAEALIDAGVLVGPAPRRRLRAGHPDPPGIGRAARRRHARRPRPGPVTSPGGTTAAGLRALEAGGVRAAFLDAVVAAATRAGEMG